MSENLEMEFERAMYGVYINAKTECGYNAEYFHQMLDDMGGVATAKRLLDDNRIHDGLANLWELGRLDLTVEATIWDNVTKWRPLFTDDELKKVEQRLRELGYFD